MAGPIHIMIVEARFYAHISDALLQGVVSELEKQGATYDRYEVSGAFEIPGAIRFAIEGRNHQTQAPRYDGYIALGCVIRGETTHYETICAESARGLMDLSINHGVALANGILTVENEAQAMSRASVKDKNKGGEFAQACLSMVQLRRKFGIG
ncbi:MAG: 6,7-dimethyl-8-ribityllumazine synthase [Alphaproteobacteria bacterium]